MSEVLFEHDTNNPSPLNLFYNAEFKEDNDIDFKFLDEKYLKSLRKFTIIFANTEISVYKILHYLHYKFGLKERDIKTVDGLSIESYFDPTANHKYNMIKMEYLLKEGLLRDVTSKWLVMPNMSSVWTAKLAYYFYNEIREAGALGIIFYSEGEENFGKILVENTYLDVLQFPKEKYDSRQTIQDDGW